MILQDRETERDITNPYITLYNPQGNFWVALNTETFGKAQNELIHPHSEDIQMRFDVEGKKLYKVIATVGKQDHPFDWERREMWTRGVRDDGADDAIALVPIGFLLEDIVKSRFSKSFDYFEELRKEEEKKYSS